MLTVANSVPNTFAKNCFPQHTSCSTARDTEEAQLLNVASIGGYLVVPEPTLYCATKFFVSIFTESIDHEMRGEG